jgi:hypothetical protein
MRQRLSTDSYDLTSFVSRLEITSTNFWTFPEYSHSERAKEAKRLSQGIEKVPDIQDTDNLGTPTKKNRQLRRMHVDHTDAMLHTSPACESNTPGRLGKAGFVKTKNLRCRHAFSQT